MYLILFKLCVTRDVVNLWRGSNPDHNANKTVADVALALKQYKQITQQPQNTATSRARYIIFACYFILDVIFFTIVEEELYADRFILGQFSYVRTYFD